MVRHFGYNHTDLYDYYNIGHPDYPNLPPPPNPSGLQTFMLACVEVTVEQIDQENGAPKNAQEAQQARAMRRK